MVKLRLLAICACLELLEGVSVGLVVDVGVVGLLEGIRETDSMNSANMGVSMNCPCSKFDVIPKCMKFDSIVSNAQSTKCMEYRTNIS